MDEERLPWEQAWEITQQTLAYTNHTLLPEALEKWSVPLMEKVLPRHMLIIFNINHEFLREMQQYSFLDDEKLRRMSIIEEGYEKQVRMANLCIVGSHSVNGVSELHTDLLVNSLVPEFCAGLAGEVQQQDQRRGAAPLADEGQRGPDRPDQPHPRRKQVDHRSATSCATWSRLPRTPNFARPSRRSSGRTSCKLAGVIQDLSGVSVDPDSMFDVQIKRIHEYKRQLLNVMRIIHDYLRHRGARRDAGSAAHLHLRRQSRAGILGGQADHQADPQRGGGGEQRPKANAT